MIGDQHSDNHLKLKPRRPSSREVCSRFLSAADNAVSVPSPDQALYPIRRKPAGRKNRNLEDSGALGGGIWPSSVTERRKDEKSGNSPENALLLNRQRSCTDTTRFENVKENHRPSVGGSARHADKFRVLGKASFNSSSKSPVPARRSVDENVFRNSHEPESDNGSPKNPSFSSYSASTVSSRNSSSKPRKGSSPDSDHASSDSSPKTKKLSGKDAVRRANSITGYGSASSQWALSPGRSGPLPTSVEHKGKFISFYSFNTPSSTPAKPKGMERLWHFGLGLFKGNKSSPPHLTCSGPRLANVDTMHQLRLLHSREMQWRYVNARADVVNENIVKHTENNLVCGWDVLRKLQQSVLEKRIQVKKEKLKTKLKFILDSQMKVLESWGDMERQHLSALSKTKECLHSAVYRIPLTEGAKMSPQSASVALQHASDLTASIHSSLTLFSPMVEEIVLSLAQLAEVVAQEKLLLEECCELIRTISVLEIQERSLKCRVVQMKSWQRRDF